MKWKLQKMIIKYLIKTPFLLIILRTGTRPIKFLANQTTLKIDISTFMYYYNRILVKPEFQNYSPLLPTFYEFVWKKHVKDTVYKTNGTIRTCVKDAMSEGLVKINFTERINLTWNEERSRKIEYLNFKEVQKLKNHF